MAMLGEEVQVRSSGERGEVAYVGPLEGKAGHFVGVRLHRPRGKNDGSVDGTRYFECTQGYGVFVREENVKQVSRGPFGPMSAAKSHEKTEVYMEDFERAYAELEGKTFSKPSEGKTSQNPSFLPEGAFRQVFHPTFLQEQVWTSGPRNPEGILCDVSDQPIFCAATNADGSECVVGGADHGLKVINTVTGQEKRQLFSKTAGHHEWVTSCTFCPDGSILSAGMDSKLCHWRGTQCKDLDGHRGSISKVFVTSSGRHGLSCSYDKTARIWDLNQNKQVACLSGHKAPVLEMAMCEGVLLSGARDGVLLAWDISTGAAVKLPGAKVNGHVTALISLFGSTEFLSGDQAGQVRLWDPRSSAEATPQGAILHPGGAVNEIVQGPEYSLITAGADKRVMVLDRRKWGSSIFEFDHHKDFIYSLAISGHCILSGGGDGLLMVHDLKQGKLCYGLGANTAGVRAIECGPDLIVAAGDDGKAMLYHF
mmetsp:Transcript_17830/g.32900  ORF Transcript_17830/g.32900 Transcript_17830/m.32900 type:complete len:480 (+) Transcript_17830:52-1491(+)